MNEMKKEQRALEEDNRLLHEQVQQWQTSYDNECRERREENNYLDESCEVIAQLTTALAEEKRRKVDMDKIIQDQGKEIEILLNSARTQNQKEYHIRRASGYWNGYVPPPPPDEEEGEGEKGGKEVVEEEEMM